MTEISLSQFDLTQLFTLAVGDVIELPALMVGLDDEVVVGMVSANTDDAVTLRCTYCGVFIGVFALRKKGLQWNKV